MKTRTEAKSKRIAAIAGKVLALKTDDLISYGNTRCRLWVMDSDPKGPSVSWHDIRALAASCLTQAPDRFQPVPPKAHADIEWSKAKRKPKTKRGRK